MKRFATAYVNLFDNCVVARVVEAENSIEAMKKTILANRTDKYTREWIEGMQGLTVDEFKEQVLQGEQLVDAVEI